MVLEWAPPDMEQLRADALKVAEEWAQKEMADRRDRIRGGCRDLFRRAADFAPTVECERDSAHGPHSFTDELGPAYCPGVTPQVSGRPDLRYAPAGPAPAVLTLDPDAVLDREEAQEMAARFSAGLRSGNPVLQLPSGVSYTSTETQIRDALLSRWNDVYAQLRQSGVEKTRAAQLADRKTGLKSRLGG